MSAQPFVDRERAATKYDHGTRARYVFARCRCLPCRAANSRYQTESTQYKRLTWRVRHIGGGWWVTMRVDDNEIVLRTKSAEEAYAERDRRNAGEPLKNSGSELVPTREVVRYVKRLVRAGVGIRRIAIEADVNRGVLYRILRGEIKYTRRAAAARILGVRPDVLSRASLVSAEKTWQRLNHLLKLGYTKGAIAKMLGRKTRALQIRKDRITARTALAVRKLYERIVALPSGQLVQLRRRLHQQDCIYYLEGEAVSCAKCREFAA